MAQRVGYLRVLVVDDDLLVRLTLRAMLGNVAEVQLAESAAAARALLDTETFDVVLSDYKMPGEDGLSLLEHVARSHPSTRRILCSGTLPPDLRCGEQETCSATLSKPFVMAQLLAAVRGS
jgi:DNA-binding NtrC family response regulator